MNRKKNEHIGSGLDDLLKKEGILEEIEEAVAKKILAFRTKTETSTKK